MLLRGCKDLTYCFAATFEVPSLVTTDSLWLVVEESLPQINQNKENNKEQESDEPTFSFN